jgi:hypothetical protein
LLLYAAAEAAAIDTAAANSSNSGDSISDSNGETTSADVVSDVAPRGWVLWNYPSTVLEAKLLVSEQLYYIILS